MATLRLKGSDPVAPTLRLLASGTVSAEDWEALVGSWKSSGTYGKPLEEYSLNPKQSGVKRTNTLFLELLL
mgnify:CR=1 FL=1